MNKILKCLIIIIMTLFVIPLNITNIKAEIVTKGITHQIAKIYKHRATYDDGYLLVGVDISGFVEYVGTTDVVTDYSVIITPYMIAGEISGNYELKITSRNISVLSGGLKINYTLRVSANGVNKYFYNTFNVS